MPKSNPYLDVLIRHSYVVGVCIQILRCCHHGELYGPLVAKGFVGPFSHRADLFHGSNSVVGDEDLVMGQRRLLDFF